MELHPLGRTSLRVTRLGLGLAALGRPGYINLGHAEDLGGSYDPGAMEAQAHAVLDSAYAAGIRYFDAARSYGDAEGFLGRWLRRRGHAPGEVVVGSKWGYTYTAGWNVQAEKHEIKEHSAAVLARQTAESRAHLGEWLKLYQIHSATLESGVLEAPEVLRGLDKLRKQGWCIGLSLSGPRQAATLERARQVEVDGAPLFQVVQATWNVLEPSAGPALAEARAAGMGVIVKEALANGRLTARNDDLAFAGRRHRLEEQAGRLRCSLDALALAAVLARPWVDVVLSGAARVEHVQANVQALQVVWDAEAETALAALAEPADAYWQTRAGLAWN